MTTDLKGKVVVFHGEHPQLPKGSELVVEDLVINVMGKSWMFMDGNPAALIYAFRAGTTGLPIDDNVLYCKENKRFALGHMVHVSEVTLSKSQVKI